MAFYMREFTSEEKFDISKKGLIPSLVTEIYNNRKQAKKTMNNYIAKSVMIKDILHKRGK